MLIWVPLSWTQRILNVKSVAIWNFSKDQASPELIADCGAQKAHL